MIDAVELLIEMPIKEKKYETIKVYYTQFFHYWLNDCPVKWERIDDDITTVIKFFLPLEGESNNNQEAN